MLTIQITVLRVVFSVEMATRDTIFPTPQEIFNLLKLSRLTLTTFPSCRSRVRGALRERYVTYIESMDLKLTFWRLQPEPSNLLYQNNSED